MLRASPVSCSALGAVRVPPSTDGAAFSFQRARAPSMRYRSSSTRPCSEQASFFSLRFCGSCLSPYPPPKWLSQRLVPFTKFSREQSSFIEEQRIPPFFLAQKLSPFFGGQGCVRLAEIAIVGRLPLATLEILFFSPGE